MKSVVTLLAEPWHRPVQTVFPWLYVHDCKTLTPCSVLCRCIANGLPVILKLYYYDNDTCKWLVSSNCWQNNGTRWYWRTLKTKKTLKWVRSPHLQIIVGRCIAMPMTSGLNKYQIYVDYSGICDVLSSCFAMGLPWYCRCLASNTLSLHEIVITLQSSVIATHQARKNVCIMTPVHHI